VEQLPESAWSVQTRPRKFRTLGPVLGALAVTMFFTANTTPATASDLAGGATPTNIVAPISGQSLTASVVALSVDGRDGYAVTEQVLATTQSTTSGRSGAAQVNTGTGDIRWPFPGVTPLSSDFGPRARPCAACSAMHEGIDMIPGKDTPIGAIAAGTVRVSGMGGAYGQYAIIDHQIDGQIVSSLYAHMVIGSSPLRVGDRVNVGDLVGLVGNSGVSTGAHLHLSILLGGTLQIDPQLWLEANVGRML
jgi:murein DD-endopeptidase MepM/ murein hydrolase activator NlpD